MTKLQRALDAWQEAQGALDAIAVEANAVNAQEDTLRRRYPASNDALERATVSLALQQEIPALRRRVEARQASAQRDVDAASERLAAVQQEIAAQRASIARRMARTAPGGELEQMIVEIQDDADRRVGELARALEDELAELPAMRRRLQELGGELSA